jgi:hypothetical protein
VTPNFISLGFVLAWTALAAVVGIWAWRRWQRARRLRVIETWLGEISEIDFPRFFSILLVGEMAGVAVAGVFVLIGMTVLLSMVGSK